MKRIILLLTAVLLLVGCNMGSTNDGDSVSSESREETDNCVYNDFYWGMDRNDIIKEKGEPTKYFPDDSMQYNEEFMGDSCTVNYCFDEEDKLNKIVVTSDTIEIYKEIKDKFIEEYGNPINDGMGGMGYATNWKINNTDILLEESDGLEMYAITYSLFTDEYSIVTTETTTETTTVDDLKIEVANTYKNIWDMVDKSSDIYGESVSAIANESLSYDELIKITSSNDEIIGQYIAEVSEKLSPPVYDDDYALAAYDYLCLIKTITSNCYLYAQTKDGFYLTQVKTANDGVMDKLGNVMNERRKMPEKAGYTLAEILVAVDDM